MRSEEKEVGPGMGETCITGEVKWKMSFSTEISIDQLQRGTHFSKAADYERQIRRASAGILEEDGLSRGSGHAGSAAHQSHGGDGKTGQYLQSGHGHDLAGAAAWISTGSFQPESFISGSFL